MNKRLQAILDLVQQSESLTPEEKKSLTEVVKESDKEITITEFKLERTEKVKHTTAILLEETIAELEQKRKSVEIQNRELEIEAALERVRSRSMAMRQSTELGDLSFELVKQVQALGIATWHCAFNIYDEGQEGSTEWGSNANGSYPIYKTPREGIFRRYYEIGQQGESLHIEVIGEDRCADHYAYLCTLPGVGETLVKVRDSGTPFPKSQIDHVAYFKYGYLLFITFEPASEAHDVFKRFAKAFEQTYTRFLDLQQAEAQTREAQIQLALERVRARTMAMQKSDELREVVATLYEQLSQLNFDSNACNIIIIDNKTNNQQYWVSGFMQKLYPESYNVPYFEHSYIYAQLQSWKQGKKYTVIEYSGKTKKEFDKQFFSQTEFKNIPQEVQEIIKSFESAMLSTAFFTYGALQIIGPSSLSDENAEILQRFASVFDQTYTRFLDLQKAEAQAKEAQIEAAMERIRARAMAMHTSSELIEVANVLREQMRLLDTPELETSAVLIYHSDLEGWDSWYAFRATNDPEGRIKNGVATVLKDSCQFAREVVSMYQSRSIDYTLELRGAKREEWLDVFMKAAPEIAENAISAETVTFDTTYFHFSNFHGGSLLTVSYSPPLEEIKALQRRSASVFGLAYQRFVDLQKAEAQAREAQIEAALERVRSRSMGMQKSEELKEVIRVVYEQFVHLNIRIEHTGFLMDYKERDDMHIWLADQHEVPSQVTIPYFDSPHWNSFVEAKEKGIDFFANRLSFEEKNKFYQQLFTLLPALPDEAKEYYFSCPGLAISTVLLENIGLYIENFSGIPYSDDENATLMRFGKVFQQTYTRFLDLKKAETQTREAQIEVSLERVRARAMGMHHSDELSDVLSVLFDQFDVLGIRPVYTFLSLIDLDKNKFTYRQTGKGGQRVIAQQVIDLDKMEEWKDLFEDMRAGKIDPINCLHYPKESLEKVWEVFDEIYSALPPGSKVYPKDFPDGVYTTQAYCQFGYLGFDHTRAASEEDKDILQRFAKEFTRLYQRFLDLQKAEAQAREAKIEAGLERVRSRAMAMQTSEELNALIGTVFTELTKLDLVLTRCVIMTYDNKTNDARWWMANSEAPEHPMNFYVKYHEHPPNLAYFSAWRERTVKWIYRLEGTVKKQWDDFIFSETELKLLPDFVIAGMKAPDRVYLNASFYNSGNLTLASLEPLSDEHFDILIRFAKVFDLTYTRFSDLKQAEAQAREAKIEAALERVRSRTMGMQHSEELVDVASILFQQVKALGVPQWNCGFNIWDIGDKEFTYYPGSPDGIISPSPCKIPLMEHPVFISFDVSRKRGDELFVYEKGGDFQADHYRYMLSLRPGVGDLLQSMLDAGFQLPTFQIDHVANFLYGNLIFITYEHFPEMHDVFKRFAKVFEQTYTRFLDLQKAEAQTREAQIEASLERVRSKAMAMHKSDDLTSAVAVVFDELEKLDIGMSRCGIGIHNKEKRSSDVWTTSKPEGQNRVHVSGDESMDVHHLLQKAFDAWLKQEDFSYVLQGEDLAAYYKALQHTNFRLPESEAMVTNAKTLQQHYYVTTFPAGALFAFRENPFTDEAKNVMKRFANVFNLTYKRFQDIQKAEAQAREATIEASLEKVRGKAMAMHNSNDLIATASLVFTELRKLGINSFRSGVGLLTKENRNVKLYSANSSEEGGSFSVVGWAVLDHHPVLSKTYDSWVNNEDYYPVLKGEMIKSYYAQVVATFTVPVEQSDGYEQHGYFLPFSEGLFYGWSEKPYTETEIKILHRFRGIVDLTFRRYMELEKSESIAKEAIRQASLDRVRAEIASMRTTNDLDRITPLIWKELSILSIPFVRCGVFIMDEAQRQMHTFLSTPDGKAIAAFHLPYETSGNVSEILSHWLKNEMYISHWDESAFSDLGEQLVKQGAIPSKDVYMSTIPSDGIHLHCLPFLQGMLYVGNTMQLKENDIHLIQSVADAFSTAYARYEDFNKLESAKAQIEKTLTDLKQTQNLLVQSEKMASLGELTAGIAHEIQNPLNFVNNFSEVSNELLEEMKEEIVKGNYDEVETITNNIKQNLEKILHHGKRADGIVKGMLQHSRSSSGVKEPTDINALADEYLRLAYHGFRAKDKSFNASTITNLDKTIGKINVVPQDIGRVVLNLITNAFYAVTEKQKQTAAEYHPTVSLSTRRRDDCLLITVKDNGNGIPEHIREKIFQPFFTTKPTGQGTGLGLSLSYDIVKAHGGELKVETKESDGSEFVLQLPLS